MAAQGAAPFGDGDGACRTVKCPVCEGERTKVQQKGRKHALSFGPSRTEVSTSDLLRCLDCGFGFSAFRPREDQLAGLYREMDAGVYEAETPGRLKTALRHMTILNRYHRAGPGRLLEIGSASGRFLSLACQAGWECTGVEPSAVLCERARLFAGRARVIESTLQDAGLAPGTFDAIAMFDVLEHVPEPLSFLRLVASLMKPDAVLLMNLPDLDSLAARLMGRHWPLQLPEHLNYFNRTSLARASASVGLRCVGWGRRPASFSVSYILYRLSQHGIPGMSWLGRRCGPMIGNLVLPVYMGELWLVCRSGRQTVTDRL